MSFFNSTFPSNAHPSNAHTFSQINPQIEWMAQPTTTDNGASALAVAMHRLSAAIETHNALEMGKLAREQEQTS